MPGPTFTCHLCAYLASINVLVLFKGMNVNWMVHFVRGKKAEGRFRDGGI